MEWTKVCFTQTSYKKNERFRTEKEIALIPDSGEENYLLNIYPSVTYQVFEGFGGALTESAGYIY